MRTYTLYVGKMAEAERLFSNHGFPALQRAGLDKKLFGYFQADTGNIYTIMHFWRFEDDADRRSHWAAVLSNQDFLTNFSAHFRPLVMSQEVQLFKSAPWGPKPLPGLNA
jgi:hypothetical protein